MSAAESLEIETPAALQYALALAEEHGLPVFPCKPTKAPYTAHGLHDASRNIEQIAEWWERWPDARIGVPTGSVSKLFAVDVDPEGAKWHVEHSAELSGARVHKTQRGSHLLYRMPTVDVRNSASKIAPGVDIRATGGYIIWWPAHGFEAFGPEIDELSEPPPWLLAQLALEPKPAATERAPDGDRIPNGQRDSTLASLAGTMRRRGMDADAIFAALSVTNANRCDPPLEDRDVRRIASSISRYDPAPVKLDDFHAYMPDHRYIFEPTRDLWPASSIDARLPWPTGPDGKPMKPSKWLDESRPVEQMVWSPGDSLLIKDRIIDGGGWVDHAGCTAFNLYRPPAIRGGDPGDVGPWLDHVECVYPRDHMHVIRWLAHRVQRPGEKINHALVLGGKQGIGKDTLLEPVKQAVGPWNFVEVSPTAMLGRFNGFVKAVILRISEARDLGDVDRFAFYDHTKVYTAAPPDVLRCDEKNLREHSVLNVMGVIITTNHKTDGIYLPADDRRHYVAWSDCDKTDFTDDYWQGLYGWYARGGVENVAAYLGKLDLTGFDPKAPPPKTEAFWHIVNAARAPEETELADVLESLGNPSVITIELLTSQAKLKAEGFAEWLQDRRNRRQVPHRLEGAGYEPVRNDASKDGLWTINGRRQVVYAKTTLTVRERIAAAQGLGK